DGSPGRTPVGSRPHQVRTPSRDRRPCRGARARGTAAGGGDAPATQRGAGGAGSMMRIFDWPWLTVLAPLAGGAMLLAVLYAFRQRLQRLARFGAQDLVSRLVPPRSLERPRWRALRLALVVTLALLALAGPRWGREISVSQSEGIDVVLALDASL